GTTTTQVIFSRLELVNRAAVSQVPRPSQDIPARWLVSTIDQALGTLRAGRISAACSNSEPCDLCTVIA
ncbi:hypothetical protein ACTXQV_81110, partial [Klebsiella pneumoniae]